MISNIGGSRVPLPDIGTTPSKLILPATRPQLRCLADIVRFMFVFASRRFGKTTLGVQRVILKAQTPNPIGLIWWVSPTYRQARKAFRMLVNALKPTGLIRHAHKAELIIQMATGWRIEFRSAEIPDNLRGEGVDLLIIDEMRMVSDEAWTDCLRPTIADTSGEVFGIGTPGGRRGWGYEHWRRGQDPAEHQLYKSFRFTAYDALFIPLSELNEARRTMPRRAFDQEFMAAFLDGVGTVFEDLRQRPKLKPVDGEPVAIGADWAKKIDYTFFVAVGVKSGAILATHRMKHGLSYLRQVELLGEFVKPWRLRGRKVGLSHDQTGVGEAVADLIDAAKFLPGDGAVEGLVFSNQSKKELVEETIVDFEAGKLGFVDGATHDPTQEVLMRELEDYTITISKHGKVVYGSPEGMHDDGATALFLANKKRRQMWRTRSLMVVPKLTWI